MLRLSLPIPGFLRLLWCPLSILDPMTMTSTHMVSSWPSAYISSKRRLPRRYHHRESVNRTRGGRVSGLSTQIQPVIFTPEVSPSLLEEPKFYAFIASPHSSASSDSTLCLAHPGRQTPGSRWGQSIIGRYFCTGHFVLAPTRQSQHQTRPLIGSPSICFDVAAFASSLTPFHPSSLRGTLPHDSDGSSTPVSILRSPISPISRNH